MRSATLCILLALCFFLDACSKAPTDQPFDRNRVYTMGYGEAFPYHFSGADGQPAGLAVELVREAARRGGIRLEWRQVKDPGIDAIRNRNVDFWVLLTLRPERNNQVHITAPYLIAETNFLVPDTGKPISIASLRNGRIACLNFDVYRRNLNQILPGATLVRAGSVRDALAALDDGRADAAYLNHFSASAGLLAGGNSRPLRLLNDGLPPAEMGIGSSFANAPAAEAIRDQIRKMVTDGTARNLAVHWGFFANLTTDAIVDIQREQAQNRILRTVLAVSCLIALLIGALALRLRREQRIARRNAMALQASEERWQLAINGATDGIWDHNLETGESHYSDRWKGMLGYSPDELEDTSATWSNLVHPEDLPHVSQVIRDHLEGRSSQYYAEYRIRAKCGEYRWILARGSAQRDSGGRAVRFTGIHTDITDRKVADSARAEAERQYRDIFEGAIEGIFRTRATGEIITVNPAFARTLGYETTEELMTAAPEAAQLWVDSEERSEVQRLLQEQGVLQKHECRFRRKDGTPVEVSLSGRLIRDADGAPCFYEGFIQDITDRKRAEQELLASEQRFRVLSDHSPVGVYVIRDGRLAYVNAALADGVGLSVSELTGSDPFLFIDPRDRAMVANQMRRRLVGEVQVVEYEFRGVCRDGSLKNIEVRGSLIELEGKPAILGNMVDVTARKRAEEALRHSENLFRSLYERAPVGIALVDAETGRISQANPAFCQIMGRTAEQLGGTDLAELLNVVRLPEQQTDHRCIRPDGSLVWVRALVALLEGAPDDARANLVLAEDITERKSAEEALIEAHQFNQQVFRSAREGIVVLDTELRYRIWNPFMEELTGIPSSETLGQRPVDVFLSLTDVSIQSNLEKALRGERTPVIDFPLTNRSTGRQAWASHVSGPLRNASGDIVGVIANLRDITEAKRSESEKARLELEFHQIQKLESVGRVAGGVAHDFNNLLTVINGYSKLLLKELTPSGSAWSKAQKISTAGERAAGVTKQLLAFSRKQAIAPRIVDVNEIVNEIRRMLPSLIGEDIHVIADLDSALGPVLADPDQIHQVLMNLIVNARDAMPDGGTLLIETHNCEIDQAEADAHPDRSPGRRISLVVTDTGVGMDQATLSQAFEPFYTTKPVGKGTGLGLSTVYGIVRQNGGWVDVTSELNRGSQFRVLLPRIAEPSLNVKPGASAGISGGNETILVVEDQELVRSLTVSILQSHHYSVLEAANATEAFAVVSNYGGAIDLLLTDVVLPGMNGKELSEALMRMRHGLSVMFMSGYTGDVISRRGVLDSGLAFINKPFTSDDLAAKVREVLNSAAAVS